MENASPRQDRFNRDHQHPFRDQMFEGCDGAAVRIAAIGPAALRDWYGRFRDYRHPGSYGSSGCDSTFSAAFDLFSPDRAPVERRGDITRAVMGRWGRWGRGDS